MNIVKWKKEHSKKTIFQTLITVSFLGISLTTIIAVFVIILKVLPFMEQVVGQSRVEILHQMADSSSQNRANMVNVMDSIFDDIYDSLLLPPDDNINNHIQNVLDEYNHQMTHLGLDYYVDVIMKDKREFYSRDNSSENANVKNTYWYIQLRMGEKTKSWTLYYNDQSAFAEYELVYGRAIFDEEGKVIGVMLVSDKYEQLLQMYKRLLETVDRIFILDSNGYTISHSNRQAAGMLWVTNMTKFEERYAPYNSSRIVSRGKSRLMISDYKDEESGWVYVMEQDAFQIMSSEYSLIILCILIIVFGLLVSFVFTCLPVRSVSNRLHSLSEQVREIDVNNLQLISVDLKYEETYVLGSAFNSMIQRVNGLISNIEKHEKEKQRMEYDFLHAQLNPHFLNNTIVAIKSLIALGNIDRAEDMMQKLIDLLSIPATPEIQFVTLREELWLIEHFVSIMNCRTEKGAQLILRIPDPIMELTVPRMILQPLVGNSFFHGFAEKDDDCSIEISATYTDGRLSIRVTDNGEGMARETIERVMSGSYQSQATHHGIGLRNVKRRLQIIYGEQSDVRLSGTPGMGTTVELLIVNYVRMEKVSERDGSLDPGEKESQHE